MINFTFSENIMINIKPFVRYGVNSLTKVAKIIFKGNAKNPFTTWRSQKMYLHPYKKFPRTKINDKTIFKLYFNPLACVLPSLHPPYLFSTLITFIKGKK